jgi:hypothetical protein
MKEIYCCPVGPDSPDKPGGQQQIGSKTLRIRVRMINNLRKRNKKKERKNDKENYD